MRIASALAVAGTIVGLAVPAAAQITQAPNETTKRAIKVETVAKGLVHPWGLAFLPDGRQLVTERPGRMRIIGKDGKLSEPLQGVPAVYANGQGGLLDVVLSPDFAVSGLIYFSYAEPRGGGSNATTVARARLVTQGGGGRLDNFQIVFRQEPSYVSSAHFGSRIVFMPDASLFITLGERYSARDQAQNPANHLGKLIRVLPDGRPHPDNPKRDGWRPEIWSIGHRNVQGAALNPTSGRLWTIEHGARGGDEINIPQSGKNYGWPVITYGRDYDYTKIGEGTQKPGMEQPIYYWDPSIVLGHPVQPRGVLWQEVVRGCERLEKPAAVHVKRGEKIVGEESLLTDLHERIRDVRQGPDGAIWLLTDDPQGRVLRVVPAS